MAQLRTRFKGKRGWEKKKKTRKQRNEEESAHRMKIRKVTRARIQEKKENKMGRKNRRRTEKNFFASLEAKGL